MSKAGKIAVGSLCARVTSGGTPSTKHPEYYGGTIPWLRTQEVDFKPIYDTEIHITDLGLENSSAKWIPANSVIVAMYGATAGRIAIAKVPLTTNQACCNLIVDPQKADYRYVYYALMHNYVELSGRAKGSAQTNLNAGLVKEFEIPDFDLPAQKRIADILSAYDDLIENNRRRMEILEESARLIYRKLFGGKKANGAMVDIAEVCDTIGGGTPNTSIREYWEGGTIPWVVPTDVTRNTSLILLDTERKITQKGLESSSSRMLPAQSILMTSRASVGYFAIANFPVCTNQGFISIVPHEENMRYYLLHNLMERVEEIRSNAKGSTFPEISKTRFRSLKIKVPSQDALNDFQMAVEPIYNQVKTLAEVNRKLAKARDMLLPKLMSGEFGGEKVKVE